ncbi:MAG TPA: hypothetical protein VFX60_13480 [Micromonospora sp.]|nr:hypothetical protein [Micromonospora sp.]
MNRSEFLATVRRLTATTTVVLVAVAASVACTSDKEREAEAIRRYGHAPTRDPNLTLQPDVVLIDGGPKSIVSASGDGLTWTIDGSASGVKELKPGKVMFASAYAVGRVVKVSRSKGNAVVTLAPVQITDVIRDGHLKLDQKLDFGSWSMQEIPDHPAAVTDPGRQTSDDPAPGSSGPSAPTPGAATESPTDPPAGSPTDSPPGSATESPEATSGGSATTMAAGVPITLKAPRFTLVGNQHAIDLPKPGPAGDSSVSVGSWSITPKIDGRNLGFDAAYSPGGLKLFLKFRAALADTKMTASLPISAGKISPQASVLIDGIKSVSVDLEGGSENGLLDNQRFRIEVPVTVAQQVVPIYGIPTTVKVDFRLHVQTAFSAKNSTISGSGAWELSGQIGSVGGKAPQATMVSVIHSLTDSIQGISVGVNGLVFGAALKITWGLGTPLAIAGPYGKLVVSVGITNGSDLGIVKCRGATLKIVGSAGMEADIAKPVQNALNKLFGAPVKSADAPLASVDIFSASRVVPDRPICRG